MTSQFWTHVLSALVVQPMATGSALQQRLQRGDATIQSVFFELPTLSLGHEGLVLQTESLGLFIDLRLHVQLALRHV